ncbi:hypothetical protein ACHAW6_001816 [Cyclotella cf. meneghiniana]
MIVNHRLRILGSTHGHPGSWNDKTVVLFDTVIRDIKHGDILDDYIFKLYEMQNGETVRVKYRGVGMLVNNGYHARANTNPPFSNTVFCDEIQCSAWLESMRKDVECTFGIIKGRWRILKTGIRLHAVQSVDIIRAICSALHNMLLEVDGLDKPWDGVFIPTSQWEGDLGELEEEDVPFAMHRLLSPGELHAYDNSSTGSTDIPSFDPRGNTDGKDNQGELIREVCLLSLAFFRSRLVEHFNIVWRRNEVVWPS